MAKLSNLEKTQMVLFMAEKWMEQEELGHQDVAAFNAPGECNGVISQSYIERIKELFEKLELSVEAFNNETSLIIRNEASKMEDPSEPPPSYYLAAYIENLLNRPSRRR